jgi:hypothetical protein
MTALDANIVCKCLATLSKVGWIVEAFDITDGGARASTSQSTEPSGTKKFVGGDRTSTNERCEDVRRRSDEGCYLVA